MFDLAIWLATNYMYFVEAAAIYLTVSTICYYFPPLNVAFYLWEELISYSPDEELLKWW
jgi:hypothetical protein